MSWSYDVFLICNGDNCTTQEASECEENADQARDQLSEFAEDEGWLIDGDSATCPKCLKST